MGLISLLFSSFIAGSRFLLLNIKIAITAIYILLAFSPTLYAANIPWTGNGDGTSWTNAANWDNNTIPTNNDNAIFPGNSNVTVNKGSGTLSPVNSPNL